MYIGEFKGAVLNGKYEVEYENGITITEEWKNDVKVE